MRVAVIQITSIPLQPASLLISSVFLAKLRDLVVECKQQTGANFVFLPEAADYINDRKEGISSVSGGDKEGSAAQFQFQFPHFDQFVTFCSSLAKDTGIWLFTGLHEPSDMDYKKKSFNSYFAFNDRGEIVQKYRKIHLFDIQHEQESLSESATTEPGNQLVTLSSLPLHPKATLGFQICYDLRFPELSMALCSSPRNSNILLFPSAFSTVTGPCHWEPLLRARAIETQSFVIAPAQVGVHGKHRKSYGHSMIIDPWGRVLASLDGQAEGFASANLDLSEIERVRRSMPIYEHKKEWLLIGS